MDRGTDYLWTWRKNTTARDVPATIAAISQVTARENKVIARTAQFKHRYQTRSPSGHRTIGRNLRFYSIDTGRLHHLHRTVRHRFEKRSAVALGKNAVVENDDDALVLFCPDEPADALAEFQNRFRQ